MSTTTKPKVTTFRNIMQDEARWTDRDTHFTLYRLLGTDHVRIMWTSPAAIKGYVDTQLRDPYRFGDLPTTKAGWKRYAEAVALEFAYKDDE